jgi:hypothetical protein
MQRSRSFQFFDPFGVGLGGMRAALMIKRLGSDQVGNLGLKVGLRPSDWRDFSEIEGIAIGSLS